MTKLVLTHAETFAHDLGLYHRHASDQKTAAERKWRQPKLAPKPQAPCDHGLFSDDAAQVDLVDLARRS